MKSNVAVFMMAAWIGIGFISCGKYASDPLDEANIIVDLVGELSPATLDPMPQFVTVQLRGGRSARLEMGTPMAALWFDILEFQLQSNTPVYLEVDLNTKEIQELLVPMVMQVAALTPTQDAVEVELNVSAAIHGLKRSNPDFAQILDILEAALQDGSTLWVTETRDEHEIIDVRPPINY
jgi:hypothetical protein